MADDSSGNEFVEGTLDCNRYMAHVYVSPKSASWSTPVGRVRGRIASTSGTPPSRVHTSAKAAAGSMTVPSPVGIRSSTSSRPIPMSPSRSGECVLVRSCRLDRLWTRAKSCGNHRMTSGWSESSGSSSRRGPDPSSTDHSNPNRRNVPSENSVSVCQAPLWRQCSYFPRRCGVPRSSLANSSSWS